MRTALATALLLLALGPTAAVAVATDALRLTPGTTCGYVARGVLRQLVGVAPKRPSDDFLARAYGRRIFGEIEKVPFIDNRALHLGVRPEGFVNASLDFLEAGGEAMFTASGPTILRDGRKVAWTDYLAEVGSTSGDFGIVREGDQVRLHKIRDGDFRLPRLRRRGWNLFEETGVKNVAYRERFKIAGEPVDGKSKDRFNVYFLGSGDNGRVYRYEHKRHPERSWVLKQYGNPLNMLFENQGLNLLRRVPPVDGVSVVKKKFMIGWYVGLEDVKGINLLEAESLLSPHDWQIVTSRLDAFEASLNEYMKRTYWWKNPDAKSLRKNARELKELEPELSEAERIERARQIHEDFYQRKVGDWGTDFWTPFHLDPTVPGALLPARINLAPQQIIVNPYDLHVTIVDSQ